ncbi:MAG: prefoldin subunit alpha [Candidatus Pacearchaeota archaeon]|nr:prefoldin subunit alpha [Candidatus Pacearchaeota archaeon]
MEEKEELLMKLGMFEQQIQQLQQQIEAVERGIVELNSLDIGLDELINGKDKEIFASIGRGIFIKAKLISEELNVDVGGGNFVRKTIPETKELIEEQIEKLEDVKKELEHNLEKIGEDFTDMMKEAEEKEGD